MQGGNGSELLQAMVEWCEASDCRRAGLLRYFAESLHSKPPHCCDFCDDAKQTRTNLATCKRAVTTATDTVTATDTDGVAQVVSSRTQGGKGAFMSARRLAQELASFRSASALARTNVSANCSRRFSRS